MNDAPTEKEHRPRYRCPPDETEVTNWYAPTHHVNGQPIREWMRAECRRLNSVFSGNKARIDRRSNGRCKYIAIIRKKRKWES